MAPAAYWASWVDCLPGVCTSTTCVCSAWKYQSGPDSLSQPVVPEVGEWIHGWSRLPLLSTDHQALRKSQRGLVFRATSAVYPCQVTTFSAEDFRTLLLVVCTCPSTWTARLCKCGEPLDVYGHHRSACSRVGLLKPRGTQAEVCMARICREAGTRVRISSDLNIVAVQPNSCSSNVGQFCWRVRCQLVGEASGCGAGGARGRLASIYAITLGEWKN